MTGDLLTRLRAQNVLYAGHPVSLEMPDGTVLQGMSPKTVQTRNPDGEEAAAEIERLRAELSRATGRQRVSIIDQDGKEIGHAHRSMRELTTEEAFVDERGTAWMPPTAWAYFAACRARDKHRDSRLKPLVETEGLDGEATKAAVPEGKSP